MKKKISEKQKIHYKENFREYWQYARKCKGLIFFLAFLAVFREVLALADKFLFKYIVDGATEFSTGIIAFDVFLRVVLIVGVVYLSVTVMQATVSWLRFSFNARVVTQITTDLKKNYFSHIVRLDHRFHTTHKTGTMISRLNRASGAMESFTESLIFNISPFIIQFAILIPTFYRFGWQQALILALMATTYFTYSFVLVKGYTKDRRIENDLTHREKGAVSDIFTNIESVKAFGKERVVSKRFEKLTEGTKAASLRAWRWWKWIASGDYLIIGFWTIMLFIFSLKQLAAGVISVGDLVFIYTAYVGMISPLNGFNQGIRQISRTLTDMQDLFEYGKIEKEVVDVPNAKNLKIKKGDISFSNVHFNYPDGGTKLFKDFSLTIPAGKTYAFVGHSGSGKSSLVNLLYRFYDVDNGSIKIDGRDIRGVKQESLREEMSIVPQEAILFDDTIFNNIRFARQSATREEVWQAMKFAQLDKFVQTLPQKEKTIVGERGVKLSGGQKQRVSIARAILANKKILVLDEATSALDSETESEIQKDLKKLLKGRTSIVIAHRLSTIMQADQIVVMKDGKILQQGTHRELITQGGEYAKLWDLQKGGFLQE